MAGIIGDWIIRPEDRYIVEYIYRGGKTQFDILDTKLRSFESVKLVDRIIESPLGHMYTAMSYFNYSYAIPYHLLVRSVYTNRDDEILIRIGNKTCRFGRTEFALISGLSFRELDPVGRSIDDVPSSSLIARVDLKTGLVDLSRTPFIGPLEDINIANLEKVLLNTTDPEIAYKVGLIYFIEVVLYGKNPKMTVSPYVFRLVDDTCRFVSYPWGRFFWDLSMDIWKRKIDSMKIPYKRKGSTCDGMEKKKDDIAGLMVVLLVWAYETLSHRVVSKLAVQDNVGGIPRMLRWRPIEGCVQVKSLSKLLEIDALDVKRHLEPSDEEVQMLVANGLTEDDIKSQPPEYPPPVVSVSVPIAPPFDIHGIVDPTTQAGASYEAVPSVARDIQSDNGDLHNTMINVADEMRGKINIVRSDVRHGTQELIDMIDDVRKEITISDQSIVKHISKNKAEEAEQTREIWETIQRILGLMSQQNGGDGVNPTEPSHAAAKSEYRREHAPVCQPVFQVEQDAHKVVEASVNEVIGEDSYLSKLKLEDIYFSEDDRSPGNEVQYESPMARMRRVELIQRIDDRVVKFMAWYESSNNDLIHIPTGTEVTMR